MNLRWVIRSGMVAALSLAAMVCMAAAPAQSKADPPRAAAPEDASTLIRATANKLERQWQAGKPDMSLGSVGNNLGYGFGYLKEAKCVEASWYFERAIKTDEKSALSHLLLGISYFGQGRADAADYLQTAGRLDPKLKPEADPWTARAAALRKPAEQPKTPEGKAAAQPAKAEPAPNQPAARAARPDDGLDDDARQKAMQAGPPPGNYTCHEVRMEYVGGFAPWKTRFDYKGYFALQPNGVYRWLDNGPTGRYQYDPATGKLTFSTGYFANINATGQFIPRDKVWQINLKIPAGPDKFNEWQAAMNR